MPSRMTGLSGFCGAVDGSRTRYLQLGRLPLYQMSYYRKA